jgi:hypothetical protein
MTLEEYKKAVDFIIKQAEIEKKRIATEYALSNNPVSIGDIVEDHFGKFQVTSVGFYYSMPPCCTYSGIELKKDSTPKKKQSNRVVFQSNLIKDYTK